MALRPDMLFQLSIQVIPPQLLLDDLSNLCWLIISPVVVLDFVLHFHNGNRKSESLST